MAVPDDGGGVGDEGTTNVAAEVATAASEPKRCWHMILNCGHVRKEGVLQSSTW
jgi:hypothetical protein